jgi:cytochrome c peroxidase
MLRLIFILTSLALALVGGCVVAGLSTSPRWTSEEMRTLNSLAIDRLGPLPVDHSNRYADDSAAAALGHRLFFDTRLSSNGKVSCATCHQPEKQFQDGVALAVGVGTTARRTMPIAGTAYSPWMFWDGRKDGLWSQALGPLESPVEHGGSRGQYAHIIEQFYRSDYEKIFGTLPDLSNVPATAGPVNDPEARGNWDRLSDAQRDSIPRVFTNIGKAIAAYERKILFGMSRFDRYIKSLSSDGRSHEQILTPDEVAGLKIFIGRGNCTQCHNGPLLTDNVFHNTGVPARTDLPEDLGRSSGVMKVLEDEFNCRSRYSDGGECTELEFVRAEGSDLIRAYKTPTLRGVAERAPYMHAGQFTALREVLTHYNHAAASPKGHTELKPLDLSTRELAQLEAFLGTLTSPLVAPAGFLASPQQMTPSPKRGKVSTSLK